MAEIIVFTYESATAEVLFWNDGRVTIPSVHSKDEGKGHAKGVLGAIVTYADERRIDLSLVAHAAGDEPRLSTQQLKVLYEKFGFVATNDSTDFIVMERKAQ